MLALLRQLFQHQAYADAAMVNAIRRHDAAARDQELRTLLHHMLVAHRFWVHLSQGLPFTVEEEARVPESLELLVTRYRETQVQEREWLARSWDRDLVQTLESPFFSGRQIAVHDGLLQVCLHSQGHRSQCAARLRMLGGEPPPLDFILWLKDRPAAVWDD